jgi:lipoate-protein ligase A
METLRFITTDYTYADFSTSISPAIELAMERRESKSTVVLNRFRGGSFTVGVLEDPEKSLDLDYCRRHGYVVRRRQNAGGAVWGPKGGAIIVLYLDTALPWVPMKTVKDGFQITLTRLAEVVQEMFHIPAVYRPLNDVEVEGRKVIATSARLENGILTMRLLTNVAPTDREVLTSAIRMPVEKTQDKKIKEAGARFTCLESEIGKEVTDSDLEAFTRLTVEKVFGRDVGLVPGGMSPVEERYSKEYQEKFVSDEWFYANSERTRFKGAPKDAVKKEGRWKAPAGLITTTLLLREDKIHDLIITGDFHPSPSRVIRDMEDALRGKPADLAVIEAEMKRIFARPDVEIPGVEVKDVLGAFTRALQ